MKVSCCFAFSGGSGGKQPKVHIPNARRATKRRTNLWPPNDVQCDLWSSVGDAHRWPPFCPYSLRTDRFRVCREHFSSSSLFLSLSLCALFCERLRKLAARFGASCERMNSVWAAGVNRAAIAVRLLWPLVNFLFFLFCNRIIIKFFKITIPVCSHFWAHHIAHAWPQRKV